jgi:hypothetical protein
VTILQSGNPFTVSNTAAFAPVCSSGSPQKGICPAGTTVVGNTGGDYNADGDNYDFPNVTAAAHGVSKSRGADVYRGADFLSHSRFWYGGE